MSKRLITIDDLTRFTFTGSPALSPDGELAVYVVTTMDGEKNSYASSLFLTDSGSSPRQLTRYFSKDNLVQDHSPVWSENGKWIYFLSNRTEKNQVWRISPNGGEAELITELAEGTDRFVLSPDGQSLICQSLVKDPSLSDNSDVTIVTRLRYLSNGKGFVQGGCHLFYIDIEKRQSEQLTSGDIDASSVAYAPDGKTIFYCKSKPEPDKKDYLSGIYMMDLASRREMFFYQTKGLTYDLQVSPDGKRLAFAGDEDGECSPKNIGIWLVAEQGGPAECLTEKETRSLGNFIGTDARYDDGNHDFLWDSSGESLTYLVTVGGNCGLRRVDLTGRLKDIYIKDNEVVTSFDQKNGRLACVISNPLSTGDLYFLGNDKKQQQTDHNFPLFGDLELSKPMAFTYKGADDWPIEGWVLFPPKPARPKGKYPVVLEIHGGPGSAYGNSFHHEFQCLAAEGYAVVYTNPRGSRGYGETFCAACYGDWGKKDRIDILKGLDDVLDHFPVCDKERLFVTGGSYGGFMTNTIVGRTHRFTAAVTQRSISNLYSFFGTSDIGYFFGSRQLGDVDQWEDEDKIMSFSPIRNARHVSTPICIIHSENDDRCPIEQAEQWYVALRRLGVETRFIRIKGENHELSRSGKPKNRLTRLREIIGWFNRHNRPLLSNDQ